MLKQSELLNREVIDKLRQYGIGDADYTVKLGKYHSEERQGVPYRTLVVKKALPGEKQTDLEMDIRGIDASLCVIFKK